MFGKLLTKKNAQESVWIVYAVGFRSALKRYYVLEDIGDFCPYSFDESEFAIIDNRNSVYWHSPVYNSEVSFKEWAEDPEFYHKLFEGEAVPGLFTDAEAKAAIRIFQKYKALMDLEFALPSVTKAAIDLDYDFWVMCPDCDEAWQDTHAVVHEMVKCPRCFQRWLSPLNVLIKNRRG